MQSLRPRSQVRVGASAFQRRWRSRVRGDTSVTSHHSPMGCSPVHDEVEAAAIGCHGSTSGADMPANHCCGMLRDDLTLGCDTRDRRRQRRHNRPGRPTQHNLGGELQAGSNSSRGSG